MSEPSNIEQFHQVLDGFQNMVASLKLTDEQLGKAINNYIDMSCDNGWEGFSNEDLVGISKLFNDMIVAFPLMSLEGEI